MFVAEKQVVVIALVAAPVSVAAVVPFVDA